MYSAEDFEFKFSRVKSHLNWINLQRYNCSFQLHADEIVSIDLDFKMQLPVYWQRI